MLCLKRIIPEIIKNRLKKTFFSSDTHNTRIKVRGKCSGKVSDYMNFHLGILKKNIKNHTFHQEYYPILSIQSTTFDVQNLFKFLLSFCTGHDFGVGAYTL